MFNLFEIFNRSSNSVFITAEIGINHQGNIDFAKKLVESAKECGADAVKFQVFKTERFYNRNLLPQAFDLFKSFELSYDQFFRLKEFSDNTGIIFYATPLDEESLSFLVDIGSPVIKIASSDSNNEPFLYKISEIVKSKKIIPILSTGFVNLETISRAVMILNNPYLVLEYCVSKYPSYPEDFDMRFLDKLSSWFHLPVGFSDHSLDNILSLAAVSLGARVIERHFTTDNSISGADHEISLNPEKFRELVFSVRQLEKALGNGEKKITEFENKISYPSMRSIYSGREIKKGELIGENDLMLLRPGNGITLGEYFRSFNKVAEKDYSLYEKI